MSDAQASPTAPKANDGAPHPHPAQPPTGTTSEASASGTRAPATSATTGTSSENHRPVLHADWVDPHAYGIVKALQKAGHETYLVGGCVRDLLIGMNPKDFDIATMAHPPQVKRIIHMAFIIGKRFRLVLVKRGDQQYEVATFRREFDPNEFPADQYPDGPPPGDNVFGTPEEDAVRRDFTINALFYDPIRERVIDYVGGQRDIEARVLRMIGDPDRRLVEDPIRMLRALRLAHKIRFALDPELRAAITRNAASVMQGVLPRRREELLKILRLDDPFAALVEAHDLGLLRHAFPSLDRMFETPRRTDIFRALFEQFSASVLDDSNTTQLFGWLLYAMLETWKEEVRLEIGEGGAADESQARWPKIDNEDFARVMRDEFGMYKFEQSAVVSAVRMIGLLERSADYRRKGDRRQNNVVRREGFTLALRLGICDHRLAGEDIVFWLQIAERLQPEIEAAETERRNEKSSRRRRGRRGGRDASERSPSRGQSDEGGRSAVPDAPDDHDGDDDSDQDGPDRE